MRSEQKKMIFKETSNFVPYTSGSNNLENYLLATKLELAKVKFGARRNLSASENLALKALKQNKYIIIRKAEQGTTIAIQNRSDYIAEGLRQLNNGVHY